MHENNRTTIDGVEVRLSFFGKGGEKVRVPYTGAGADARGPRSLTLTVRKAGLLDPIGRALGLQDVPTGSSSFDRDFVVKSNQPDAARVWLHEDVCRAIAEAPDFQFELEDGRATAECPGLVEEVAAQRRAMAAVAALARGMSALERSWQDASKRLDAGRVRRSRRRWPRIVGSLAGHEVVVRLRRRGERIHTVVQTDRAPPRADDLSDEAVAALGGSLSVRKGVMVATLPGICDDEEELFACIEAAVRRGIERRQAYR